MIASGYQLFAINPFAASRYRERHTVSVAKSDPGDAKVLAELVRTDRQNHRLIAGDSELAEAVKILARGHQNLIWTRQRQMNSLRSTPREFYPAALEAFPDLDSPEALAVLAKAPTPYLARGLSKARIVTALKQAGRRRGLEAKAKEIGAALRTPQLEAPALVAEAFGANVAATVALLQVLNRQVGALEKELSRSFEQHPDAEILHSLPGLGQVLGARVLAEFGDDPARYANPKARKCYAGQRHHAEAAEDEAAAVLEPMGLKLSTEKTRISHLDEGFDFRGFRIRRHRKQGTNTKHVYTYPTKTALATVKAKVRALTCRARASLTLTAILHRLNYILRGWANYFRHAASARAFAYLNSFTWWRVARWLRKKHPRASWKRLRAKYFSGWVPEENGTALLYTTSVTIVRYRYRGASIPTRWTLQKETA